MSRGLCGNQKGEKRMSETLYDRLSTKRKKLQSEGLVPEWYTTAALQMFEEKYEYQTNGRSVKGQFERIAKTAAKHIEKEFPEAENNFFNLLWNGWLSPSTPVLANMGTDRGMPVSCSGGVIGDSIDSFYKSQHELAMLTKYGFGTSSDLSNIRPRGSKISVGGKASGVLPVYKMYVETMRNVAQGTSRRGAWAGYLDIEHGDFDELWNAVNDDPDDSNIGWVIRNSFIEKLNSGDTEAVRRYQKALKLKMVQGKGYFCFVDKINAKRPAAYVNNNLTVKASNLCDEITLHSDEDHVFTCVLSSMNVYKYDEWKDTDAVFWATIFLDCVAEEFIQKGKDIPGLEKAIRSTIKGRALGLGQCGWHSLLQKKRYTFGGFDAQMLSMEIAQHIFNKSAEASTILAFIFGEPEWCKGTGLRNTHRIAIAPTKSTALLMGGISEGINPDPGMVYTQNTAAGVVDRIVPEFLLLLKEKGHYSRKTLDSIISKQGSVQHLEWLTDEEKAVFKTAFEINQKDIIRQAATRGKYLDQWQSLNLFFPADEDESWISEVHQEAFENKDILGLYYIYTQAGVTGAKGECEACQ
jgi:ribonucleoside-diphosphate reductase alpha chain